MDPDGEYIHYEDPFRAPPDDRDPARRLRGAIAKGLTVWTAGEAASQTGLTVASILIAEGTPSHVLGLINDTTDLYEAIVATGRFVVHVLGTEDRRLAEIFAGVRPAPRGPFAELDTTQSEWGPVIAGLGPRAYCTFVDETEPGFQKLLRGRINEIDMENAEPPLIHYRGGYRTLPKSENE